MHDRFGKSSLSDVYRTGSVLTFKKQYPDGREFDYTFRYWRDGFWVGEFRGSGSGGQAFCVLVEDDPNLYDRNVNNARGRIQEILRGLASPAASE